MFNAETGTWECGRLSYCLEYPEGDPRAAWLPWQREREKHTLGVGSGGRGGEEPRHECVGQKTGR